MDTKRFILLIALGLVSTMIWQTWQQDYAPQPDSTELASEAAGPGSSVDASQPATPADTDDGAGIPSLPEDTSRSEVTPTATGTADGDGEIVRVTTDVYDIAIDSRGGTLAEVRLLNYPVSVNKPDQPFVMLTDDAAPLFYVAQGGVLSERSAPSHKAVYRAEQTRYQLDDGEDSLEVRLKWQGESGVEVDKIYTFQRDKYEINVRYEIRNGSDAPWRGWVYGQLQRNNPDGGGARLIYTYTGAAISSPDNRYDKIDFGDIRDQKLEREITNGWAAMLQHYFVSALLPSDPDASYRYYTSVINRDAENSRYVIGTTTPPVDVAPGAEGTLSHRLYIGPKLQHRMEKLAPSLELTVDYGMLWFIAKPLFWGLEKFHALTGNWGWSIILLTLLIKIVFYKLSAAGYRSMARMRKIQPRLMALRERYADDKQRLNQAMMDMYKTEKINPLGGCFPILVQIPVFIALYWVLLESVELRQAPFILWIEDLSIPDPWYVLPLVMGVTMFIQQKLNPAPVDPVQEKIMMSLPVVFTVFFAFFPAGLVLYWVVNNVLSIAQQWLITRNLEREGAD